MAFGQAPPLAGFGANGQAPPLAGFGWGQQGGSGNNTNYLQSYNRSASNAIPGQAAAYASMMNNVRDNNSKIYGYNTQANMNYLDALSDYEIQQLKDLGLNKRTEDVEHTKRYGFDVQAQSQKDSDAIKKLIAYDRSQKDKEIARIQSKYGLSAAEAAAAPDLLRAQNQDKQFQQFFPWMQSFAGDALGMAGNIAGNTPDGGTGGTGSAAAVGPAPSYGQYLDGPAADRFANSMTSAARADRDAAIRGNSQRMGGQGFTSSMSGPALAAKNTMAHALAQKNIQQGDIAARTQHADHAIQPAMQAWQTRFGGRLADLDRESRERTAMRGQTLSFLPNILGSLSGFMG